MVTYFTICGLLKARGQHRMSKKRSIERAPNPRRFKPYPAYRDSGIEWPERRIPAHWEVRPLKCIGDLQAGAGFPDNEQGATTDEIPFFKVGDMGVPGNERRMVEWQHTVSEATARRLRAFVLPADTIVFAKVGAALMLNRRRLLSRPSCIDNNMMGFIPANCDSAWALYWLRRLDMAEIANPGAVPSVNEGQIRNRPVIVPPKSEQRAIAVFLDRETARIDTLVAKKERLIELLQEKRTTIISRAVTKGLDPNVPMKDSGVEWMGKIPAHWEARKVKRCCLVRRGASPRPIDDPMYFDDEGEYAWVRIADVTASERYLERTTQRLSALGKSKSVSLEPRELFVSIAATVGKPIITKIKCCIHDGFVYFVGLHENREFLYYVFSCGEPYKGRGKQGTQLNLNTDTIGDIYLPLPSREEQEGIVEALDRETARVDTLIAKVRDAIDRLKEFRTALISAAVTGKIDVREEVA